MSEPKTIDDLRAIREELVIERRRVAYKLKGFKNLELVEKLAAAHTAIEALDAVIAEGLGEPEAKKHQMFFLG